MTNDVAQVIIAIAASVATVMGPLSLAYSNRIRTRVAELEAKTKRLEESELESRRLLRVAVRNIRDWLRWDTSGRLGDPPSIPDDLKDEV
ncbi:hypothetical protein [Prescottella equi]|uniref:hypothetical protein n=1 Tax=Rhodococcus hoagii TaxID=43767 RepID=UPI000A10D379|nr:hypothetical protein [Prescottella equi]ORL15418.1 hypothetical protein A6I85_05955 [Prescottella equi]